MNFKKYLYILITIIVVIAGVGTIESSARKSSKGKTTQSSKTKNSKSKSSKSKKSSRKKKSSKRKSRYSKRKNARSIRQLTATVVPPPVEVVSTDSLTMTINDRILAWIPQHLNPGGLRINNVKTDKVKKTATVALNENFTYLPVTKEIIDTLTQHVVAVLPDSLSDYHVSLNVGSKNLAYYITKVDKLPTEFRKNPIFVKERNPLIIPSKGMDNDIIALWHSHGRYFKNGTWVWQRPLLFQSLEDTYTMGYILPFVVPMLENAGAYVLLPRERDTNLHEVIVDNDINPEGKIYSQPYYKEKNGREAWTVGEEDGFIYDLADYRDTENPFENGTYRQVETVRSGNRSIAGWYADIPDDGEYAIYVSYKTLPNSTEDAHYQVNYSGGTKEFIVNQTMGGSTWVYLGTFPLLKGYSDREPIVTLTNETSGKEGTIVTADAVKIGGGMGNIARSSKRSDLLFDPSTPENSIDEGDDEEEEEDTELAVTENIQNATTTSEENDQSKITEQKKEEIQAPTTTSVKTAPVFKTSGLPRFLEGARYWMHWAGIPEEIYSPFNGTDDYKDDYTARGHWVNYLAGGSRVLPGRGGLNIPIDLSLALHTDAGKRNDDSIVGTLGIYFTQYGASYIDGTPRINSRMLTDIVMRQITNDIRQKFEPAWTRRSMWDKSYLEARVAEVPTTLIELLSHQNFGDMQYGLDPEFRFTVGRAIYKGVARFLAERKDRELIIQPLPIKNFAIERTGNYRYHFEWEPTPDTLEPTAMPDSYAILERKEGELGFHKIAETDSNSFDLIVNDNKIHSYQVIALNRGGASFPSETLSLREADDDNPILIVNGFTRVSAPAHFSEGGRAGFDSQNDFGVPYIKDISFTGYQNEFNRYANDFGHSSGSNIGHIVAGNNFDYPNTHGKSIAAAGKGFVSASVGAVENDIVNLSNYHTIDLILGKQKASISGKGSSGVKHRAFPISLQTRLSDFSKRGGNMIITGEYAATDLFDPKYSDTQSKIFATETLGITHPTPHAPADSLTTTSPQIYKSRTGKFRDNAGYSFDYSSTLNDKCYIVEGIENIIPADNFTSEPLFKMSDSDQTIGIVLSNQNHSGSTFIMSLPFESISTQADRDYIMKTILSNLQRSR